jgi:hypothetical protein
MAWGSKVTATQVTAITNTRQYFDTNSGQSDIRSFLLSGVYKARIGVESTGATDTHTTASFSYRKDGVNA